jgi:curved DNA-binding protein CbpA
MEAENHYDTLGLRPDASHREVLHAFSRLAERYRKQMSDPAARQRLQEVKAAYQTLTDYGSRLSYNIERGLPDPPNHGKEGGSRGLLAGFGNLVPDQWPVLLPILFLIALRLVANHAIEIWQSLGSPTWGP